MTVIGVHAQFGLPNDLLLILLVVGDQPAENIGVDSPWKLSI